MPKKRQTADAPLPSTLERSPEKAQATYEETLASAEKTYAGDEARAHRAAWGAVKHSFEKVGDHWESKDEKGPSDPRSEQRGPTPRGPSYGGVDALGNTKAELLAKARSAGAEVTTRMTKPQIAEALAHANARATRKARESGK
jgi:cation transport regulator ChaB